MSVAALLVNACSVYRKTTTIASSVNGAPVSAWAKVGDMNASIQLESDSESFRAGREAGVRFYQGYFEYGTDIQNGDYVLNGTQWMTVVGYSPDDVGRQAYARVTLREHLGEAPV